MVTVESMIKENLTRISHELILHHDIKGFVDWAAGNRDAYLNVLELFTLFNKGK